MGSEPSWSVCGFVRADLLVAPAQRSQQGWAGQSMRRPRSAVTMTVGRSQRQGVRLYAVSDELMYPGNTRDPLSSGALKEVFEGAESVMTVALGGVRTLIDVLVEIVEALQIPPQSWGNLSARMRALDQQLDMLEREGESLYKDVETFRAVAVERAVAFSGVKSDPVLEEFKSRAGAAETKVYQIESAIRVIKLAKAHTMVQLSSLREQESSRHILLHKVTEEKNRLKFQIDALSTEIQRRERMAQANNSSMQSMERFEFARAELADSEARIKDIERDLMNVRGKSQMVALLEETGEKLSSELDSEIKKSKQLLDQQDIDLDVKTVVPEVVPPQSSSYTPPMPSPSPPATSTSPPMPGYAGMSPPPPPASTTPPMPGYAGMSPFKAPGSAEDRVTEEALQNMRNQQSDSTVERVRLREANEALSRVRSKLENELSHAKQRISSLDQLARESGASIGTLVQDLEEEQAKRKQLEERLDELEDSSASKAAELGRMNMRVQMNKQESSSALNKAVDDGQRRVDQKAQQIWYLKYVVASQTKQMNELSTSLADYMSQKESLTNQIEEINADYMAQLEATKAKARSKVVAIERDLWAKINKAESDNKKRLEQRGSQIWYLKEVVAGQTKQNTDLNTALANYQQREKDIKREMHEVKEELTSKLQRGVSAAKKETASVERDLSAKINKSAVEHQKRLDQRQQQIWYLKYVVAGNTKQIHELDGKVNNLQEKEEALTRQLHDVIEQAEAKLEKSLAKVNSAKANTERDLIRQIKNAESDHQKRLEQRGQQIWYLKSVVVGQTKQVLELNAAVQDLQEREHALAMQVDEVTIELTDQLDRTKASAKSDKAALENKLLRKIAATESDNVKRMQQKEQQIAYLKYVVVGQNKQIADLQSSMAEYEEQVNTLSNEITEIIEDLTAQSERKVAAISKKADSTERSLLEKINKAQSDHEKRLEQRSQQIWYLKYVVSGQNKQIADLKTSVAAHQEREAELTRQMSDSIDELRSRLEKSIRDGKSRVANVTRDLTAKMEKAEKDKQTVLKQKEQNLWYLRTVVQGQTKLNQSLTENLEASQASEEELNQQIVDMSQDFKNTLDASLREAREKASAVERGLLTELKKTQTDNKKRLEQKAQNIWYLKYVVGGQTKENAGLKTTVSEFERREKALVKEMADISDELNTKLEKTIKEAAQKTANVERTLKAELSQAQSDNQKRLEQRQQQIWYLKYVVGGQTKQVGDLTTSVTDLQAREDALIQQMAEIKEELESRMESSLAIAREKTAAIERNLVTKIKKAESDHAKRLEQKAQQVWYLKYVVAGQTKNNQDLTTSLADFKQREVTLKREMAELAADLSHKMETSLAAARRNTASIERNLTDRIKKASTEHQKRLDMRDQQIWYLQKVVQGQTKINEKLNQDLDAEKEKTLELSETIHDLTEDFKTRTAATLKQAAAKTASVERRLTQKVTKLESDNEKRMKQKDENLWYLRTSVQGQTKLNLSLTDKLQTSTAKEEELTQQIADDAAEYKLKLDATLAEGREKAAGIERRLVDKIKRAEEDHNRRLEQKAQNIWYLKYVVGGQTKLNHSLTDQVEDLSAREAALQRQIVDINEEFKARMQATVADAAQKTASIERRLNAKISQLQSDNEKRMKQKEENLWYLRTAVQGQTRLNHKLSDTVSDLEEREASLEGTIEDMKVDFDVKFDQSLKAEAAAGANVKRELTNKINKDGKDHQTRLDMRATQIQYLTSVVMSQTKQIENLSVKLSDYQSGGAEGSPEQAVLELSRQYKLATDQLGSLKEQLEDLKGEVLVRDEQIKAKDETISQLAAEAEASATEEPTDEDHSGSNGSSRPEGSNYYQQQQQQQQGGGSSGYNPYQGGYRP